MQTIANHRQNQKQRRGLAFLGKRRELGGVVSPGSPEGSWRLLAGWAAAGSDRQGSQSGEKFPSSCWKVRWFASSRQDAGACLFLFGHAWLGRRAPPAGLLRPNFS